MALNKLLNSLTAEDLIKRLEKESNDDLVVFSNDVQTFFSIFKLEPGSHSVTAKLLYGIYRLWADKPLPKLKFGLEASNFILRGANDSYLLNVLPSELKLVLDKLKAKPRNKIKSKAYKNRYEKFISKYSIKPGDYWIEDYVLFYLYDKDRYTARKTTHFSLVTFAKMSRLYFESKFVFKKNIWYFKVDESIKQHLEIRAMENLRKYKELQHEKKEQSKK